MEQEKNMSLQEALNFLDEKDLKIESNAKCCNKTKMDIFRSIFIFIFNAVRKRKTYCLGKGFTSAKRYLQNRGWINLGKGVNNSKHTLKKIDHKNIVLHNLANLKDNAKLLLKNGDFAKDKKGIFLFLVMDFIPNYIWITHRSDIRWNYVKPDQILNRFPRVPFTTKTGLNRILNEDANITMQSQSFFPRCYELTDSQTFEKFLEDYKFTACSGVLRWYHEKNQQEKVVYCGDLGEVVSDGDPKLTLNSVLHFCINFCQRKLSLDKMDKEHQDKLPFSWQTFFQYFYTLHKKECIEINNNHLHQMFLSKCSSILEDINTKVPQSVIDGTRNVWILKPGQSSRGKGIIIRIKLEDILVKEHRKHLVIQKYIEKPLLIYDTKFDIRQWLIVTSWNPLVIWMSRISYLRFCSQVYTLDSFHESIHLCNNAVQSRYCNGPRSPYLPEENMWTSETFVDFLRTKGLEDYWSTKIYPGIKNILIETMIASKGRMMTGTKHQTFELFGADFMLTQDFCPWLIEINASPAIGPSTSITSRLVPLLLKDILAVTTNPVNESRTCAGSLERIYCQTINQVTTKPKMAGKRIVEEDQDRMIDFIDKVMSVPSYVSSNSSRISMLKKWLKKSTNACTKRNGTSSSSKNEEKKKNCKKNSNNKNIPPLNCVRTLQIKSAPQERKSSYIPSNYGIDLGSQNKIRRVLRAIPIASDERILVKYKCNHCL